jgi:hypothetical protein
MISRPKVVSIGYTVVNAYIALMGLLYLWEASRFRCRISDHGFPVCFFSMFLVIPIAAVALWMLNRRCRKEHGGATRLYFGISRALFSLLWLASCVPVSVFVAITQPWPLTLCHGPDTRYARAGFERLIGFAPPASVSEIYYRADEGFLDSGYRLRFRCNDNSVVTQMVARLQLQESNKPLPGLISQSPKWWSERMQRKRLLHYARERTGMSYHCYLWYDPVTGTVWYEEFSV